MADTRKIVKVFLASPGDLSDERRAAKIVVDEFNKLWADTLGYHVELVGWEDTVSRYGRPQELINQDLDLCELFIGMMWKKWGTPPSVEGEYTSGFEEEFERSIRKRTQEARPEISLLFKQVAPDLLNDPGDELRKVMVFKERIIARKTVLFETFSDIGELEGKIRSCIAIFVDVLIELGPFSISSRAMRIARSASAIASSICSRPPRRSASSCRRQFCCVPTRSSSNGCLLRCMSPVVAALLGPREMFDLSLQSGPKRTLIRSLSPIVIRSRLRSSNYRRKPS
jgi:hypothetical protein